MYLHTSTIQSVDVIILNVQLLSQYVITNFIGVYSWLEGIWYFSGTQDWSSKVMHS